ncbi:unnamed protein product [Camellia sinensis]
MGIHTKTRWAVAVEETRSAKSACLEPQKKAHASSPQLRLLYVALPRLAMHEAQSCTFTRLELRRAFKNTGRSNPFK